MEEGVGEGVWGSGEAQNVVQKLYSHGSLLLGWVCPATLMKLGDDSWSYIIL